MVKGGAAFTKEQLNSKSEITLRIGFFLSKVFQCKPVHGSAEALMFYGSASFLEGNGCFTEGGQRGRMRKHWNTKSILENRMQTHTH